jgi:hypothetical protein
LNTTDKEEKRLSNWFGRQKKRKHISAEHKMMLEQLANDCQCVLGRKEEEHEKTWKEHFDELMEYRSKFHTFVVSKKDFDNQKLCYWIAKQRKNNRNGSLSNERRKMLLEVGFDFEPCARANKKRRFTEDQERHWDAMYSELLAYKAKYGHSSVTINDQAHKQLGEWVYLQRVNHRQNTMDEYRRNHLDDAGFIWFPRQHSESTLTTTSS